jgi:adenylate cyclase
LTAGRLRVDLAAFAFARITRRDRRHHAFLAAIFAQMGDGVAAAAHAAEVVEREPGFTVAAYVATQHYKRDVDRKRHEAGLPPIMRGIQ